MHNYTTMIYKNFRIAFLGDLEKDFISAEEKIDLPAHITLNSTGLIQANGIEPIIASLPLKMKNGMPEGSYE